MEGLICTVEIFHILSEGKTLLYPLYLEVYVKDCLFLLFYKIEKKYNEKLFKKKKQEIYCYLKVKW